MLRRANPALRGVPRGAAAVGAAVVQGGHSTAGLSWCRPRCAREHVPGGGWGGRDRSVAFAHFCGGNSPEELTPADAAKINKRPRHGIS